MNFNEKSKFLRLRKIKQQITVLNKKKIKDHQTRHNLKMIFKNSNKVHFKVFIFRFSLTQSFLLTVIKNCMMGLRIRNNYYGSMWTFARSNSRDSKEWKVISISQMLTQINRFQNIWLILKKKEKTKN